MNQIHERIAQLEHSLEGVRRQQASATAQIQNLQTELDKLKQMVATEDIEDSVVEQLKVSTDKSKQLLRPDRQPDIQTEEPVYGNEVSWWPNTDNIEKWIGENLLSKIGILILIIGVGIGTKYAIDHNLISPWIRIALGYLTGIALGGIALKIRTKYDAFSAVLLSGAMAILYFVTFAAYNFFSLIPQLPAFGLMVACTVLTVIAAIRYKRELIAVIGMVGAYAVPVLLSDGSGNAAVLFSYITLINAGILFLAFRQNWRILNHSAFIITWLAYLQWFTTAFNPAHDRTTAVVFPFLFFGMFYGVLLAYHFLRNEKFESVSVILLVCNAFFFFGVGYSYLNQYPATTDYKSLFCLVNSLLHGGVCYLIYRRKLSDLRLCYLCLAMVISFVAIAVPVQFSACWVTLWWAVMGVLLCATGHIRKFSLFEYMGATLLVLSLINLLNTWAVSDEIGSVALWPFVNIFFVTNLIMAASLTAVYLLSARYPSAWRTMPDEYRNSFPVASVIAAGVVLYFSLFFEISRIFNIQYELSQIKIASSVLNNYHISSYKTLWLINYSMAFAVGLLWINRLYFKKEAAGHLLIPIARVAVALYLTLGLYTLSNLRDAYLQTDPEPVFPVSGWAVAMRYICLLFVVGLYLSLYRNNSFNNTQSTVVKAFNRWSKHISWLWIATAELLNIIALAGGQSNYKLAVTILWALYAFGLLALGIWKKQKDRRMGALVLLSVVLVKLFFYDLEDLDTIRKTVVMVVLGIILLGASFLYTKFKSRLFEEE